MEGWDEKAGDDLLDRAVVALRAVALPPGPPPAVVRRVLEAGLEVPAVPLSLSRRKNDRQGGGAVRRLVRIAVAASIVAAVGIFASRILSPTNIAFANVAYVLECLQSATFDMVGEMASGDRNIHVRARGFYLAPSRQRIESANKADRYGDMVIIADYKMAKGIVLLPAQKTAITIDSEKIKDQINNPMACMFETMRCLVREGRSGAGTVTSIGPREIDGQKVVGFRAQCSMGDMILWADLRTAKPVRIELNMPAMKAQGVLSNFRYDVQLNPALFSLDPPPGYIAQTMGVGLPSERGLIETLRAVAEERDGMFPKKLGMNREVMEALEALAGPDLGELATSDPAVEAVLTALPIEQKYLQGILFYLSLKPENEAHYAGGGVKLGTPNRAVFWYKPTGGNRFRVIYADLHVAEMSADQIKALPGASR